MANPGRPRKCDPRVENLRANIRLNNYSTAKATLKDFGVDVTDGDGRTALINAVIEKKIDFIHWLIENGANINKQDRNGYSSLHFASSGLSIDIAQYLLDKGANPNLQDRHGNSSLWTAVFNSMGKDIGIVKILLKYNANPDLINNYDNTPGKMYKERYGHDISTLN
jgi:uncharacterized protein